MSVLFQCYISEDAFKYLQQFGRNKGKIISVMANMIAGDDGKEYAFLKEAFMSEDKPKTKKTLPKSFVKSKTPSSKKKPTYKEPPAEVMEEPEVEEDVSSEISVPASASVSTVSDDDNMEAKRKAFAINALSSWGGDINE